MDFFGLVVLALFVEALVDTVRTVTEAQHRGQWKGITMGLGVAVAVPFQVDLLAAALKRTEHR